MTENRDEGDRREGTTRENEECSAANNGILLGEKFSSVSLLGDPVKLHPRSLALHPAPPSMVPGVPVIFRNIAESRGGPVAELAGYRWLGKSFSNGKENWLHCARSGKWKTLL